MSDKLTDAELDQMQRWVYFNRRDEWANIETRSVQELLDHIAALNREIEAIKGRLTEDALYPIIDGLITDNSYVVRAVAKAIIAHVLNGEQK